MFHITSALSSGVRLSPSMVNVKVPPGGCYNVTVVCNILPFSLCGREASLACVDHIPLIMRLYTIHSIMPTSKHESCPRWLTLLNKTGKELCIRARQVTCGSCQMFELDVINLCAECHGDGWSESKHRDIDREQSGIISQYLPSAQD